MASEKIPWQASVEFESVSRLVRHAAQHLSDGALLDNAVSILTAWSFRVDEVPIGVRVTCELLTSVRCLSTTLDNCSSLSDRMILAAAIVRFVNHTVHAVQARYGDRHTPLHSLAVHRLQMPGWLATLRSDATHGALPPVYMLSAAVHCALHWIINKYWLRSELRSVDGLNPDTSADSVCEDCTATVVVANDSQPIVKFCAVDELDSLIQQFNGYNGGGGGRALCASVRSALQSPATCGATLRLLADRMLTSGNGCRLASGVVSAWRPVLHTVAKCGRLTQLLQCLVTLCGGDSCGASTAAEWLRLVACVCSSDSDVEQDTISLSGFERALRNDVTDTARQIQWSRLTSELLRHNCASTARVLPLFLQQIPASKLSNKRRVWLCELASLSCSGRSVYDECDRLKTLNDSTKLLEQLLDGKNNHDFSDAFRLCDGSPLLNFACVLNMNGVG